MKVFLLCPNQGQSFCISTKYVLHKKLILHSGMCVYICKYLQNSPFQVSVNLSKHLVYYSVW